MRFFKTVLAVIVGFFTSIFLTLLIFIGMASFFAPKEDLLEIKDNSILSLDFQEEVHEYGNPIHIKDFDYDISEDNTLTAILRAIEYAKTDKQIKGIVL
ncbi:MAG: signal peptide peptidase SppA, partial [Capnocytophaga sp.]|nr:signal peptide peptidase SppA [Capnocytophaga sp.]